MPNGIKLKHFWSKVASRHPFLSQGFNFPPKRDLPEKQRRQNQVSPNGGKKLQWSFPMFGQKLEKHIKGKCQWSTGATLNE